MEKRRVNEIKAARKLLEAAELKRRNALKCWFAAAAAVARKWRLSQRLAAVEIYKFGKEMRLLQQF